MLGIGVFLSTYRNKNSKSKLSLNVVSEASEELDEHVLGNIVNEAPEDVSSVTRESEITTPTEDMQADPNEGFYYEGYESEDGEIIDVTKDELFKQEWIGDTDVLYLLTNYTFPLEEVKYRKDDPNYFFTLYTLQDTDGTYERFLRKYFDNMQDKVNKENNLHLHYILSKHLHGQYPEGVTDYPNSDMYSIIWEE